MILNMLLNAFVKYFKVVQIYIKRQLQEKCASSLLDNPIAMQSWAFLSD